MQCGFGGTYVSRGTSLVAQRIKPLPASPETLIQLFFFFSSKHALNARPCAPCFVRVGTEFQNVVFGFSETQLSYSLAVCPRESCSPPSDSV